MRDLFLPERRPVHSATIYPSAFADVIGQRAELLATLPIQRHGRITRARLPKIRTKSRCGQDKWKEEWGNDLGRQALHPVWLLLASRSSQIHASLISLAVDICRQDNAEKLLVEVNQLLREAEGYGKIREGHGRVTQA